jgi:glycosyltransferase involved in cell wall biosynthesis
MGRRILLLLTDLEIGGTPTVVRELATRLNDPPNVVVEVACLAAWGPVAQQLALARIGVTPLGARSVRDLEVIGKLVRHLRAGAFDTCFSFLIHANAVAAAAAVRCRGVRFLQSIQTTQRDPLWHWHLQRIVHLAAERIVVPSPSVVQVARRRTQIPAKKFVVIPNAVEPEAFARTRRPIEPGGAVRVGFLGRLDPIKRVQDLIEAIGLLEKRFTLGIYGDGEERAPLGAMVHERGLGERVTFYGPVERPQRVMDEIDLLVLPSAAEGFGLVLIEAMAAGVPVVATRVPGIVDVVRDRENGLLVPPRNPAALAAAIRELADDSSLRQSVVSNGLQAVRQQYAWDAVVKQYRRLLRVTSR